MKLSSIMTINVIREQCEEKAEETKDVFYTWVAETLRRVVADEPLETEILGETKRFDQEVTKALFPGMVK